MINTEPITGCVVLCGLPLPEELVVEAGIVMLVLRVKLNIVSLGFLSPPANAVVLL